MFKYETHAHTSEGSRCSSTSAKDLIAYYARAGYQGVCITDHFFNGNTTVPQDLSWVERVALFMRGYDLAKQAGEQLGINVFFGWEFSHAGTDFLTYGLGRDWLLAHPDCDKLRIPEYGSLVRGDGGFIVQAHPFREDWYIDMIRLAPRDIDAVEVINAPRPEEENRRAQWYAEQYDLLRVAGTDFHFPRETRAGLMTARPVMTIQELITAIRCGKTRIFVEPAEGAGA